MHLQIILFRAHDLAISWNNKIKHKNSNKENKNSQHMIFIKGIKTIEIMIIITDNPHYGGNIEKFFTT